MPARPAGCSAAWPVGADLVEVAPALGDPGNITAVATATLALDLVHLLALGRRRRPG